MNAAKIVLLTLLLTSCGKEVIEEVNNSSQDFQSESHMASQVNPLSSSARSGNLSNDKVDLTPKIKETMICKIKSISQKFNKEIRLERELYKEIYRKLERDQSLSNSEKIKLTKLLMKYRLLGSGKYYFGPMQFSYPEIVKGLKGAASKYVNQNGIPKRCLYTTKGIDKKTGKPKIFDHIAKIKSSECLDEFLRRAQIIPPSMVVSQATVESDWGTSRFATQATNFFGIQYRFSDASSMKNYPNCIPAKKDPNRCIYTFNNLEESLREYYRFLNAGTYQPYFRTSRGAQDSQPIDSCLDAVQSVHGLTDYAENSIYIEDINKRLKLICPTFNKCS